MKKLCIFLAAVFCLSAFFCTEALAVESGGLPGYYQGSCTTQQVDMGLKLAVLETGLLASDNVLLDEFIGWTGGGLSRSTLLSTVEAHDGEFIGVLYFYPQSEERSGSGMYTLSVNKGSDGYELKGSKWLWQEGGGFMDLMNLKLSGGKLTGDVYAEYSFIFWNKYGDVGDVSLTRQSGDRVYFPGGGVTVDRYRKQTLNPILRDDRGNAITQSELIWTSSDETVAAVSPDGTVSALAPGTAKITARTEGGMEARCTVTVADAQPPMNLELGQELVSEITETEVNGCLVPQFAPSYRVTVSITNPTQEAVTGIRVTLTGPELQEETPQTGDTLEPGQTLQWSWLVLVPADRVTGGETAYTLAVDSDVYATVTQEGSITVPGFQGSDNRLTEKDRWFFTNIPSVFKNGYSLPTDFLAALGNVERARVEDYIADGWQGADYGMAVIAALMKSGELSPGDFRQGATSLSQLPSPRDDGGILELITQYQVSFLQDGVAEGWQEQLQLPRAQRLQEFVKSVHMVEFGGMPVVTHFRYLKDGKPQSVTLVAHTVEYGSYPMKNSLTGNTEDYDKRIVLYDPNGSQPVHLYITAQWDSFYLEGYCRSVTAEDGNLHRDTEGYFVYADTWEALFPESFDPAARLETDVTANVAVDNGQPFATGDVNLSGDPMSWYGTYGLCYAPAFGSAITVTPQGVARLSCTFPGMLLTANTQGQVVFGKNGGITTLTGDEAYVIRAVFDVSYGQGAWHTVTLDGFGKVSLTRQENGEWRITGDDLRGIRLRALGKEEFSKTVASDATDIMLAERNGVLGLYADPDGDGVFDTPAEEVTAPGATPGTSQTPGSNSEKNGNAGGKIIAIVLLVLVVCGCVVGIVFLLKTGIVTVRVNLPKKK